VVNYILRLYYLWKERPLKHAVSRKQLRTNGIQLFLELTKTYKPTNVPEVNAAKAVEFWGHMKRLLNESIDIYYDRFHELLEDLQDADEPIPTKSAICQFIFTLAQSLTQFRITIG
jgi:hypothetical protein